jgi:hypothetical protein
MPAYAPQGAGVASARGAKGAESGSRAAPGACNSGKEEIAMTDQAPSRTPTTTPSSPARWTEIDAEGGPALTLEDSRARWG